MINKADKCLFVHIPKVAGRSIETYFLNRLGYVRENYAERAELLLIDNHDKSCGTEKLSHLSAAEYLEYGYISAQDFSDYYTFSFVRNPWSRLVSEYRYRNYLSHRSFKDFVMNKLPVRGWNDQYRHIMSQTEMLYNKDGELLVDFVGKFERLEQDFKQVCEHLGFDDYQLPHINSSNKKSRELRRRARNMLYRNKESKLYKYTEFYDAETRACVHDIYQQDIRNFDYTFDDAV